MRTRSVAVDLSVDRSVHSSVREVAKAVRLGKARTVVVAPNIEQIEAEGGLDQLLESILEHASERAIPVVFALSRKKLGQVRCCWWSRPGERQEAGIHFCTRGDGRQRRVVVRRGQERLLG
jgi:Ribosomal protein L7Ae/L30e/S12e/Gadd45 family